MAVTMVAHTHTRTTSNRVCNPSFPTQCSPNQSLSGVQLKLVKVSRHVGQSCQAVGVEILVLCTGEGECGGGESGREWWERGG